MSDKPSYEELEQRIQELEQAEFARKRAEKALLESEEKFGQLFESINDAVFVHLLGEGGSPGHFVKVNNVACERLGYTKEELLQLTPTQIGSSESETKSAEIINTLKEHGSLLFETTHVTKDGRRIPVESHLRLFDYNGKQAVLSISRDIAQRKRDKKEKARLEQDYQTLFREMLDGFALHEIICDAQGKPVDYRFLAVNPSFERMTGLKAVDIVGMTVLEVIPGTEPYLIETYGKVALTGEPTFFENYTKELDKHFEVTAFRPAPNQFACVFADITERKKMKAQLQQAQKMEAIGTLAGGIAHDFNNILFPIIGYTELTMDDVPEESTARKNLNEVLKSALRAKDLVQQILTFSRQHKQELKPLKVQLVIKEALKLIRSSLPTTIEIRQAIDKDCGLVMADPTHVHQIAMNLCTNAYHAMEETGGTLEVNLNEVELTVDDLTGLDMEPGSYLCLKVSDTGHGMDQSVVSRIFNPYFTTKEIGKGTGLGLAVVHGIVKSYAGDIRVYSEPGKGTVFQVYLPRIKEAVVSSATVPDMALPTGHERILLVDDEEQIVFMERTMLGRLGYHVTARTSSIEALAAFREQPDKFDLVITDMTMPNMTGKALAKELMSIRQDIPIILCTGFSEQIDERRAAEMGISAFVLKPIVKRDMANTIRKVLEKK